MLARLVARLLVAPLGFTCGVIACFVALGAMSADNFLDAKLFPEDVVLLGYELSVNAATVAILLAPLLGAPAIVAVLISEMFSIRSWTYHAVAGGLCALMPWSLAPTGMDGPLFTTAQVLAAGIIGGFIHWAVAGRRAGLAPPPDADRRPQP